MHDWRPSAPVSRWIGMMVAALAAAACDDSPVEPPPASAAARIEATTPTSVTGTVGAALAEAPGVRVTDAQGTGVPGVAIAFRVASGSVAHGLATTDADGLATAGTWTLGQAAGSQTLTTHAEGLQDVVFTATAEAGPPVQMAVLSGDYQLAGVGKPLERELAIRVTDAFGNRAVGAEVTFTVVAGEGSIEAGVAATDSSGVAESGTWTLGPSDGLHRVRAQSGMANREFSAFAVAPPGTLQGRLAFMSSRDGDADIFAVNVDGSGLEQLTTNGLFDSQPAWSPDGNFIAYIGVRDRLINLLIMAADGGEIWRHAGAGWTTPAWSPDGLRIALTLYDDFQGERIATISSAGGTASVLTAGNQWQPSWSPDGRQLAFLGVGGSLSRTDIYVMNADGTGRALRRPQHGGESQYYSHPTWSPDGTMIAFVRGEEAPPSVMRFKVAVMSADGIFLKDLAWAGDSVNDWDAFSPPGSLAWSPDGRGIAYSFVGCDRVAEPECPGETSVKYVSLDGSRETTLIADAESPSWH